MSTMASSPSETKSPIPVLAEAARVARTNYDQIAAGKTQREREAARIAEARACLDAAEGALATAQLEDSRQAAERDRQQRLQAIDAQLLAKTAEIEALQQQQKRTSGRIAFARGAHVRLQVERAAIAG